MMDCLDPSARSGGVRSRDLHSALDGETKLADIQIAQGKLHFCFYIYLSVMQRCLFGTNQMNAKFKS